jgi:hypothetical protein
MTRQEALQLLDLRGPLASRDEVGAAFRRQAKRVHPDLQRGEAAKRWGEEHLKQLTEARRLLLGDADAAAGVPHVRSRSATGTAAVRPQDRLGGLRRVWAVVWRARGEPAVQVMGWVVMTGALVAHIYPWWTLILPLGGSAVLASVLPPATSLGGWPSWARRGRAAAAEVGGLLVFAVAASAVAAGLVALVA